MKLILKALLVVTVFIFSQQTIHAQDSDKTVTLTVSGTGKTLEEAKINALRSAIEQSFGAFISSKTEILNDKLLNDEIVSISNGNVQKYDVISQIEIPNTGFAITLTAKVSVSNLTSFVESKGITVEFKGSLFAANIKLQKLNEESEIKVMYELFGTLHENFQTSFDYTIEAQNPILDNEGKNYDVHLKTIATCNKNYDTTMNYLVQVLNSVGMSTSEVEEYKTIKKFYYCVLISYNNTEHLFKLRSAESFRLLQRFRNSWNFYLGCFDVDNGLNIFHGPGGLRITDEYNQWKNIKSPFLVLNYYEYTEKGKIEYTNGNLNIVSIYGEQTNIDRGILHFKMPSISNISATFEWDDNKTLNELDKIKNYIVKPSGIISKFNNGGYVIYEQNGNKIIAYPFTFNLFNNLGEELNSMHLNTGSKLFDGKINTSKIKSINNKNVYNEIQSLILNPYNDWVIPSSDELSLIFNKLYLLGIGSNISFKYAKICSSTISENNSSVYAFTLEDYYKSFMENYSNNKNLSTKDNTNINLSTTFYNDTYNENKTSYFQPVRYVRKN
ncbi:hypothetical protein OX284_016945 [Flavobacterium sp. SUN046]|uniref:hypothetical protein n=1 Tax=Flavobacterium sp. SUN046 TaxID=3002440 RepID=UPI002DBC018B|nr:hypothetical protein [Flavobacterium sp. SUN046]MEC4051125.1 hypothetical protein [Flavobacterium sp. SUN046]